MARGTHGAPARVVSTDGEGATVNEETGEVADRILRMADAPDLRAPGADLPVLGWDNSAEVRGGDLTSIGFAKLVPGFQFTGYVLGTKVVDSQFDSVAGKGKQEVYTMRGTARVPIANADKGVFAEIAGNLTIPIYAGLQEALDQNAKDEERLKTKIAVRITYEGKNPDRMAADGGKVLRSGRHLFRVVRVQEVKAAATA